jgi:N,N'-diacetyl-8-epilegionaminate cytidylyltransferase
MSDQHIVGFVFARGGSKGVPKKNIRPLAGKPLINYSIEVSRQSRWIERTIVSTDCPEIAKVARECGAEVPFMRPSHLATDTASEWLAWRHAILEVEKQTGKRIDVFVSIPTTSPLRSVIDVDACIEKLLTTDADLVITITDSHHNPYFNMVVLDERADAHLVIQPVNGVTRRQDAPTTYDMTTVAYAVRRDFIFQSSSLFDGRVQAVHVPLERAIDIDTEFDFRLAEFYLCQLPSSTDLPRKAG